MHLGGEPNPISHTISTLGWRLALAVLLFPGVGWAYDPRLPLIGSEPSAAEKLSRFGARHADDDVATRALAEAEAAGVPVRDRIHLALLSQREDYARAYQGFERRGDNAAQWRQLLERLPKDAVYARSHATFLLGRSLVELEDLRGAAAAFEAVRGRQRLACSWTDEATLYLAQVYARLPGSNATLEAANRNRARRLLLTLAPESGPGRFAASPERIREGARWLLRELRGEGSGPLLELARKMSVIERLIQHTETGDPTQERQEQVVASLDRLIELMREKEGGG